MLYYLPLEPYVERYTYLMSCADGWAETNFKKFNIPFCRINGMCLGDTIKDGVVLDACGRSYYAMSQIMQVVSLINEGVITDDDTIYLEDFWHPGVESLFYIRDLKQMKFRIGTFIHAQSVDDTDFSYKMREWMRPIEQSFGKQYDFIFTCSEILKQLCIDAGVAREDNIYWVGLPYNSARLMQQLREMGLKSSISKEDYVLFSSRFDDEKDPMFFLDLVEECSEIEFRLVNPRKNRAITSNVEVRSRLEKLLARKDSNLRLVDTSNKVDYYNALAKAKVQFNCAHQDWVSWTLLEAITFECNPLYPIWKDFPYELNNDDRYLYQKRNLKEAAAKLRALMTTSFDDSLNKVVIRHDNSWKRYLEIMQLLKDTVSD